ncbi:MAG: ATP-binding protein [bacterium]|nr:ATP-binding protein [bacterium]
MLTTDNLVNCQRAAQYLGVSVKTVRHWAQSGTLQGKKVGSRGDWRFSPDDLNKMIKIDKDTYESIKNFLLEHAATIQSLANQKHITHLGTENAQVKNLKKNREDYVKIVKEFANNLENTKKGEKVFLKLGSGIAKKSVEQGLTLEETVDGTIFLKQAFWEKLGETGLLQRLTTHDLYSFNQVISLYADMVTSKIIFAYHEYYKEQEERIVKAEALRHTSENQFRVLADTIQSLAWIAEPDGYIYWYNKRWYDYTGTKPKDMEGWGWQSVHDPVALPQVMKRWVASIETGKQFDMTFPLKGADGIFRPFLTRVMPVKNKTGEIIQWTGTNTDISEQKNAEGKLLESQNRLEAVFESVADGISVFDMNGNIVLLNKSLAEITGFKNVEDMKRNIDYFAKIFQLFTLDGKLCPIKDWPISRVYKGESFTHYELLAKRTDINREWHFNYSGTPVLDDTGKQILAVVVTRDMTALKLAENEKKEFTVMAHERNELQKLNKAKDEFIGIASHQLRTPATAVKQYISIVLSGLGGELTRGQQDYLQTAYDSNERQLKLINDLLKTAQIDAETYRLNRKPCNVTSLLQEVADELQIVLDTKKQRLIISAPDQHTAIRVDETEMKLVFANLLENASKYSYESTNIKVAIKRTSKTVKVSITDRGVGIREEDQTKIFDKFTRIDNDLSDTIMGTGLGLYWVKNIIGMHGGNITVSSKLNKGSTFTVTLPL